MIDKDLLKNLTDEQKQALLEQLMASLSEPKQEEVAVEEPEETTDNKSDFTMHKNNSKPKGRREAVKFKKNTWQDDGIEFPDVETPKVKRTPRNRKGPQKVSVECHVCGREFQINSSLVYGEYQRCNRCGGK